VARGEEVQVRERRGRQRAGVSKEGAKVRGEAEDLRTREKGGVISKSGGEGAGSPSARERDFKWLGMEV
jgi:hypothetical protein